MTNWQFNCNLFCCFLFNYRKYSKVRRWTLGLLGGKDQIAVIRASGSISRVRSPLNSPSSGIIGEQFIEKIRKVRGTSIFVILYIYIITCLACCAFFY